MKLKFVFLLLFPLFNYAQNAKEIHGALLNEKLPLSGYFIQAIGENSNYTIAFDVTNSRGEYSISIDSNYKNIRIVVSHLEFQLIDSLVVLKKDSTYLLLNLIKKQYLLPGVQVVGKRNIQIDGDTTTYNVQGLKKNENTIEELIRKLPGFEVNNNGEIKYKNKRITTILIDGDNVIQNDYKVLSKNLTPEMVDKIQAIENYSSNELLKGIEKGNETVLNLVVNKNFKGIVFNKMDVSSTLRDSLHEINTLTLNILPQLKLINTFNKNNINRSAKDINLNTPDVAIKEEFTKPLLDNSYLNRLGQDDIFRFNNQIYNSLNIFKKKKTKYESNIKYDFLNDTQNNYNIATTSYLNVIPVFSIEESQNNKTHIESHNAIATLKIFSSSSSFLKINVEKKFIKSNVNRRLFNSFNNQANSVFDTTNMDFANLYFIKKIDPKNVLEIETKYKQKAESQQLSIIPEVSMIFFDSSYQKIIQQDRSKRNLFNIETRLKGNKNFLNYVLTIGFFKRTTSIKSAIDLFNTNNILSKSSLWNNAQIKISEIYIFSKIDKRINSRVNFAVEQNLNNCYINYQSKTSNNLFYNTFLLLKYKINGFNNIDISYKKNSTYSDENYYLQNYYFNRYNYLVKNNFNQLATEKFREIKSNYSSINIFKNQRFILINFNYSIRQSPILQQTLNNANFIIQNNQLYNTSLNNKSFVGYLFYSKIIPRIKSTIGLSTIYLRNKAKVLGRDDFLTDLISNSLGLNLSLNSKFKEIFNFEFKCGLNYNANTISEEKLESFSKTFTNVGYNSSIKLMTSFKRNLNANCRFSILKNNVTTLLLDSDVSYNFEKPNFLISLGGQNLLNNSSVTIFNQGENFIQKNSSLIFPRFLYLKFLYKFSFKL